MDSSQVDRLNALVEKCYPCGFVGELKAIFSLAWPTSLSMLFHTLIEPIALMFCGHLGRTQLASAALALSVIYLTCVSVGRGLAYGGDTFFSQAYGSTNKTKMGVHLQKSLIFGVLCAAVVCGVLLNTENILLLLRQPPIQAKLAQEYTLLFMPGALAYCWLFPLMRYFLCQNSVIPNLLVSIISCGANAILHYGFVYQANMGIKGSAISMALTYYIVLFLLVAYMWGSGMYRQTWAGWSLECLDDWGSFSRVVLSSIFMTVIFWLGTQVGFYLSGLIGEMQISVFSICFEVEGLAWTIPLGVGGACTARVGQYLGANQPLRAITACRVAFTVQALISLITGVVFYLLRWYIPRLFTSNPGVISYTARILQLMSIFVIMEGICGVGVSIVRCTGHQAFGAVVMFIGYCVFGITIGVALMFATYLELAGLLWGFNIGVAVVNICLILFVVRLDWQAEANNAQLRAGVKYETSDVNNKELPSYAVEADDAADELNRLLDEASKDDNVNDSNSSRARIILSRLAVVFGVLLIVVVLIATRMFVHFDIKSDRVLLYIPAISNATHSPSVDY